MRVWSWGVRFPPKYSAPLAAKL